MGYEDCHNLTIGNPRIIPSKMFSKPYLAWKINAAVLIQSIVSYTWWEAHCVSPTSFRLTKEWVLITGCSNALSPFRVMLHVDRALNVLSDRANHSASHSLPTILRPLECSQFPRHCVSAARSHVAAVSRNYTHSICLQLRFPLMKMTGYIIYIIYELLFS